MGGIKMAASDGANRCGWLSRFFKNLGLKPNTGLVGEIRGKSL
jgi:hypothetical protein